MSGMKSEQFRFYLCGSSAFQDSDIHRDILPPQSSLGVLWDVEKDAFIFRVILPEKPYTRRGVLSVVNSVYDPFGVVAPVILREKILLRKLITLGKKGGDSSLSWDDLVPENLMSEWNTWKDTLKELPEIILPRCYHPKNFGQVLQSELFALSDASESGIRVVIFLKQINEEGKVNASFLFGQARLPSTQHPPLRVVCRRLVVTGREGATGRTTFTYP